MSAIESASRSPPDQASKALAVTLTLSGFFAVAFGVVSSSWGTSNALRIRFSLQHLQWRTRVAIARHKTIGDLWSDVLDILGILARILEFVCFSIT